MRRLLISRARTGVGPVVLALAAVVAVAQLGGPLAAGVFTPLAVAVTLAAGAYLVWNVEPVYVFCAALLVSPIAGYWEQLGIPGYAAPDRLLLVSGIAAVLIRTPGAAARPPFRLSPVHWLMAATALYAIGSAIVVGTAFERQPAIRLIETFGLIPFTIFLVAPVVFRGARERELLLRTLVALGTYLGLTALFETVKLDELVWPRYILDENVGTHFDHARGPFVEAVTNGFAQYVCAVAASIAWFQWRDRPRAQAFAAAAVVLCVGGAFMSLERSVWLGAGMATIIALLAIGNVRRYAPLVLTGLALVVGGAMLAVPGLAQKVTERASTQETIWDRKNLSRAAANMIADRPLLGFGWNQFRSRSRSYFQQARDYPLTAVQLNVHSTILTYAVELGLLGLTLWIATLVSGVAGGLATRGPPDLRAWRIGLLAVAVCYLIVTNFVPPSVFPNLSLWLLAGVAWSGRYAGDVAVGRSGGGDSSRPPRIRQAPIA